MMVIDASIWVSFLVQQDVNHASTQPWLTKVISSRIPIAAPILLLSEVGGAIARRLNNSALGNRAITQLLAIPTLRLVKTDHSLGIKAGKLAANHQLRGADALYIAVASELNVPLLSWDKEQLNRAKSVINTYTPSNYPHIII